MLHKTYKTKGMKTKFLMVTMLIASILCLVSCSKEDTPKAKTYTLNYQQDVTDIVGTSGNYGYDADICFIEYNEANERINIQEVSNPKFNTQKTFTANENAVKVKVYIDAVLSYGSLETDFERWVQQVYYLKEGEDVEILISNETRVGTSEP